MKIFISTDMEGVAGVVSWNEMEGPSAKVYTDMLNSELDWIIEGIKESEINDEIKEIVICDSHSRGENIPYAGLKDRRVSWIRGYPRPFYMMEGLDDSYDLVMLIGYHGMIGSFRAGMDHTYSASCIYNIKINGRLVGETEVNAFYAGTFGVPVGLVSGDDVLEGQIRDFYGENFPFVRTKEAIARFSARVYNPEVVKQTYKEQVKKLVSIKDKLEVKKPEGVTELEIDLASTVIADAVSVIPGLERVGGRTVRYSSADYSNVLRMILSIAMLGGRFTSYK